MAVTITTTPAAPTAKLSACRFDIEGADDNDATTYDAQAYPSEDPIPYRLVASLDGEDDLVSPEFTVSADGDYTWMNVVFPAAGTWTLDLVDQRDDSVAKSESLVVA